MGQQYETLPTGQRRVVSEARDPKKEPVLLAPQPGLADVAAGLRQAVAQSAPMQAPAPEQFNADSADYQDPIHPAIRMALQNTSERATSLPISIRTMLEALARAR